MNKEKKLWWIFYFPLMFIIPFLIIYVSGGLGGSIESGAFGGSIIILIIMLIIWYWKKPN